MFFVFLLAIAAALCGCSVATIGPMVEKGEASSRSDAPSWADNGPALIYVPEAYAQKGQGDWAWRVPTFLQRFYSSAQKDALIDTYLEDLGTNGDALSGLREDIDRTIDDMDALIARAQRYQAASGGRANKVDADIIVETIMHITSVRQFYHESLKTLLKREDRAAKDIEEETSARFADRLGTLGTIADAFSAACCGRKTAILQEDSFRTDASLPLVQR